MRTNIRKINKYIKFSKDFKRKLVEKFESVKFNVRELGKLHKLSETSIYNWIYRYSTLKNQVKKAVKHYNTKRIHNGFRPLKMSPMGFEKYVLNLPKKNRPIETIYTDSESEFKTEDVSNLSDFEQNETSES